MRRQSSDCKLAVGERYRRLHVPNEFKTTAARSRNMRAIKSADNRTTERQIRVRLIQVGATGWKVRSPDWPGNPDFVFPSAKVAIFVDGCFWHGCPKCGHIPKTNIAYWKSKLKRNRTRDREINNELTSRGITVLRFWECEVRRTPRKCLESILTIVFQKGKRQNLSPREPKHPKPWKRTSK
jgi:DNA mismatch endonuclease, patch repair protein